MTTPRLVLLMLLSNALIVGGGVAMNYLMLKSISAGGGLFGLGQPAEEQTLKELRYEFFPIEKIIVSVRDDGREHYFVLDLILQAEASDKPKKFDHVEPLVRNLVVAYLSTLKFEELRALRITELQAHLENVLFADFANRKVAPPFKRVLVSKLIVQ